MSCYILGTKEQMAGFIKLHRDTETFHWAKNSATVALRYSNSMQKVEHVSF